MIEYLKDLLKDIEQIRTGGLKVMKNENQKYFPLETAIEILEKLRIRIVNKMKKGIDVSQHNGYINWDSVKQSGIEFAILRLGWIGNKNNHTIDTRFEENYKNAKACGIPIRNLCI